MPAATGARRHAPRAASERCANGDRGRARRRSANVIVALGAMGVYSRLARSAARRSRRAVLLAARARRPAARCSTWRDGASTPTPVAQAEHDSARSAHEADQPRPASQALAEAAPRPDRRRRRRGTASSPSRTQRYVRLLGDGTSGRLAPRARAARRPRALGARPSGLLGFVTRAGAIRRRLGGSSASRLPRRRRHETPPARSTGRGDVRRRRRPPARRRCEPRADEAAERGLARVRHEDAALRVGRSTATSDDASERAAGARRRHPACSSSAAHAATAHAASASGAATRAQRSRRARERAPAGRRTSSAPSRTTPRQRPRHPPTPCRAARGSS